MAKSAGKTGLLLCLLVLMSNVIIETEASLFWNSEASLSTQVMGFSEPLEICSSFSMCDDEKSLIYGSICPDDRDDSKFCFIRYRSSTPKWKPFCNQSISEKILTIASVTLQVQEQTFKVKLINAFNDKVQKNEVGISFNPPINECEDPCADCISLALTGLCEDNIVECNSTVCKCKEGFEGPKCCNESICRNNCDNNFPISGQLGCTKCKSGYQGRLCCEKLECAPVNLYFLNDISVSYHVWQDKSGGFCPTITLVQILTAAINPSNSSPLKVYGSVFSGHTVMKLDDDCEDIVETKLPGLIKDFYECKGPYGKDYNGTYSGVCSAETTAIEGMKLVAEVANTSTVKRKVLIVTTDGSPNKDKDSAKKVINGVVKNSGIKPVLSVRTGTNDMNDDVITYADSEINALCDESIKELAKKVVTRLQEENILCASVAKNITDRLDSMTVPPDNNFNYYCDFVGNGPNKNYPQLYAYGPKCEGDLSFGIGQHTMEEDNNLKVDRNTFEKDILAAVEDVFDKFQE